MKITTNESNGKVRIMLDASAFKESSCLLRTFYQTVAGYTDKIQYNDVEFGSAFHIFRRIVREKGQDGLGLAIRSARHYFETKPMNIKSKKKYLTSQYLLDACVKYFEEYEIDRLKPIWITKKDGIKEVLLELPFTFPYYVDDQIEILMAGTMDELGKFDNGIVCVTDMKTTSVFDIDGYFDSYRLSPQLIFYRWSIKQYAKAFPESFLATYDKEDIGCMIDGMFLSGANNPVELRRSDVHVITESALTEFDFLLRKKVDALIAEVKHCIKHNVVPIRYGMLDGSCQTIYGKCKYFNVCAARDDTIRAVLLERDFVQRPYNPLAFGKE